MENYESIKSRLLKLHALAEKGEHGEAQAAKIAIKRICQQYGVSIDDILAAEVKVRRYTFEIGRDKIYKTLFLHCHSKVMNIKTMSYYQRTPSKIALDITPLQYAELSNLFAWHKQNFKKNLDSTIDTFVDAYLNKHDLFSEQSGGTNHDRELTPEDIKRIRAMFAMQEQLSDDMYLKMIENKNT